MKLLLIKEQLKNARADMEAARDELRTVRERTELQEGDRYQLEGKLRDQDQELQKIRLQLVNFQTDNQAQMIKRIFKSQTPLLEFKRKS